MHYIRRTPRYPAICAEKWDRPVVTHRAWGRRDPTMSTNATNGQKSTVRPTAFYIGQDALGRCHYYHCATETVHIVAAGERIRRVQVEPGTERDLDAFVAAVGRERGWEERHYGLGLAEAIERGVDV